HQQRRQKLGETEVKESINYKQRSPWVIIKALMIILWRQGIVRDTRWQFWPYLLGIWKHNPGGVASYLSVCAQIEHFLEYRQIVKDQIEAQLAEFLANEQKLKAQNVESDKKLPVTSV
ncbi:MAG: DUF4070 domain-containing protein, partial [Okeania sp. SIO2D1]|nr:DUF4070 domain-containing protein [Okeania sp. SIO2D1]